MLVKSAKDTRSAVDRVKAHTGEEMVRPSLSVSVDARTRTILQPRSLHSRRPSIASHPSVRPQACLAFSKLMDFATTKEYMASEVVGIDEARQPTTGFLSRAILARTPQYLVQPHAASAGRRLHDQAPAVCLPTNERQTHSTALTHARRFTAPPTRTLQAQFFPDLLEFCKRAVDDHGKTVFVAGLDGDYRRERFGDVRSAFSRPATARQICLSPAFSSAGGNVHWNPAR